MPTFTIVFDTLCSGYEPIRDENGDPIVFVTRELAQAEIDDDPEFYGDCFVVPTNEIGHKTIFYGSQK